MSFLYLRGITAVPLFIECGNQARHRIDKHFYERLTAADFWLLPSFGLTGGTSWINVNAVLNRYEGEST